MLYVVLLLMSVGMVHGVHDTYTKDVDGNPCALGEDSSVNGTCQSCPEDFFRNFDMPACSPCPLGGFCQCGDGAIFHDECVVACNDPNDARYGLEGKCTPYDNTGMWVVLLLFAIAITAVVSFYSGETCAKKKRRGI